MQWRKVEPIGEDDCTSCGKTRELLAEAGKEKEALCPECMHQQFGSEFLENWIIDAGIVVDPEIHGNFAEFDFGSGITVDFELTYSEMPASRSPNETETVRYRETKSDMATIRFNGDTLGKVKAREWAKYVDEQMYPD